jgi:hypothetical protein
MREKDCACAAKRLSLVVRAKKSDHVLGNAICFSSNNNNFNAADGCLIYVSIYSFHDCLLDWLLPDGIGNVKNRRLSGMLSCPTRTFGAGRVLTVLHGCYVFQNLKRRDHEE